MKKKLITSGLTFMIVGALLFISFLIVNGILYRIDEENGIDRYAPPLVVLGSEVGFWMFVIGVLLLLAAATVAFLSRRRNQ